MKIPGFLRRGKCNPLDRRRHDEVQGVGLVAYPNKKTGMVEIHPNKRIYNKSNPKESLKH